MHPLVSLAFIAVLIAIGALVWAVRKLEQRLGVVETRPAERTGVKAVPVAELAEDDTSGWSLEDADYGSRFHVPPAPLSAAAHVGSRVDVAL